MIGWYVDYENTSSAGRLLIKVLLVLSTDGLRQKHFNLTLSNQLTRSEYLVAIFGAIGIFLSIYALVFIISCVLIFKGHAPGNGHLITENNANFQTVNQAYGDTETTGI